MFYKKILGLCVFVFGAVFPSFADDFVISGLGKWHCAPAVAFDDTSYLVVWRNYRNDIQKYDIYGQRVDTLGTLVGDQFAIAATPDKYENHPAIVWNGQKYLVTYSDDNYNPPGVNIDGRFVSASGTVVGDTFGISDCTTQDELYSAVAWDGTNYLVVWKDYRNGGSVWTADIYGQIVDTSGNRVGSNFPISTADYRQTRPAVAFDGTNYLVVWEDYRHTGTGSDSADIYGQRVSPLGTLVGTDVGTNFAISRALCNQAEPDIAFDGTNYLVVWMDFRNSSSDFDIYGQLIDTSGTPIDTNFAISTANGAQIEPAIVWDGMNYFVVWSDRRSATNGNIYGQKVNIAGNLIGDNCAISTSFNGQFYPDVAFDGNKYLVVWYGNEPNDSIYGNITEWPPVGIELIDYTPASKLGLSVTPTISNRVFSIKYDIPKIKVDKHLGGTGILPVSLKVYDESGRLVKTIFEGQAKSGSYNTRWDGRDTGGNEVKSGTYFLKLKVDGTETEKVIIIK